jgi:hypothetical protein
MTISFFALDHSETTNVMLSEAELPLAEVQRVEASLSSGGWLTQIRDF